MRSPSGHSGHIASTCSRESNGSPPQATAVRAIHPSPPCVALQIPQNHIWRVSVTSIQDKKSQKRTLTSKNLKPFKAADREENKLYDCQGGCNVKAMSKQYTASLSAILRSQKGTKLLHTSGACPGDGSHYY